MSLIQLAFKARNDYANASYGGAAVLSGVVSVNGSPARRRVRLYDVNSRTFIRELWSANDGSYAFPGLKSTVLYLIAATDYNAVYADEVATQTPGNWTLNVNLDNTPETTNITVDLGESYFEGALIQDKLFPVTWLGGGLGALGGIIRLSGAPVASKYIWLIEQPSGVVQGSTISDSSGRFVFTGLNQSLVYSLMAGDDPYFTNAFLLVSRLTAPTLGITLPWASRPPIDLRHRGDMFYINKNWGGLGTLTGTTKTGSTPVKRRVRLYDAVTGILIKEQWSNTNGTYSFTGLSKTVKFTVTSTDYANNYNDVIAANVTAL